MYKPNPKHFFWSTVLLQVLYLVSLIVINQFTLMTGKEVFLKTEPVDPRSLFQGDYVILRYSINTIHFPEVDIALSDSVKLRGGQTIYISLAKVPGQKYYDAKSVSLSKPVSGDFIKGKISYVNRNYQNRNNQSECADEECVAQNQVESLIVTYGVENYFIPEGQGRDLERVNRQGRVPMLVGVALDKTGRGLIKSLVIDDNLVSAANLDQVIDVASTTVNAPIINQVAVPESNRFVSTEDVNQTLLRFMHNVSMQLYNYNLKNQEYPASSNTRPPYDVLGEQYAFSEGAFNIQIKSSTTISWVDNADYSSDYCLYARSISDPQRWYYISSAYSLALNGGGKDIKMLDFQPTKLSDCEVVVKPKVATIEGYVFFDNNANKIFDAGDNYFNDIDLHLMRTAYSGKFWQKKLKPSGNGYFKFVVYDEGKFILSASSALSTPLRINLSKLNIIEVKQGDVSNHNNILLNF